MEDFILIMEIENGMSFIPEINDDDYQEEESSFLDLFSDFPE
jgi:hypothetical protein